MDDMHQDVGPIMSREIVVNEFTEKSATMFREQVLMRADMGDQNIIPIYIDSYGGYVDSLAKMLETMDEVPNRFITVAQGKAVSCGAILLSHGDLRFCGKYSRVMVHNVLSGSWGDVTSMRADADETERLNKLFLGLLATNCGMSYDTLQNIIKTSTDSRDLYMSADEALKFGIVDYVGMPQMAPHVQWSCEPVPAKQRLQVAKPKQPKPAQKKKKSGRK